MDNIIYGKNVVLEALKANHDIDSIYVASLEKNPILNKIISMAKEKGIIVKEVDKRKLFEICNNNNHSGVVARVALYKYCSVDEIIEKNQDSDRPIKIIICDGIEDPHNLGAIIRTCECAGFDGVIIPKRRSVGVTDTVIKIASGAIEYVKIARVTNLSATIEYLKSKGIWVYAADMNGQDMYKTNLKGNVAVVIGSEGKGVSKLVEEHCDGVISIPMYGHINSLNASVSAAVVIYEINRQNL